MRALIVDPDQLGERAYRHFVQRAQLEALVPDHLVLGEPYLALNALVLTPPDAAQLAELAELFASALARAARRVARSVPALVSLGFPWAAAELLAAEPARQPLFGRLDFVQDEAGHWWLLEFNADTPSGLREAAAVERIAFASLPTTGLARLSGDLEPRLGAAFRAALGGLPPGSALGLMTTAGELEDLAQLAFTRRLLAPLLARDGYRVVLGDADNLHATGRGPTLCGQPIAALYRYVPLETLFGTPGFVAIYESLSGGRLRLLNGLFGLLLQNKALLAWVWQHRDDRLFSAQQREAIQRYLPPTWMVAEAPADPPRQALVAKQVFGREGEEVFFGDELSESQWAELRRRKTYVLQQRVEVAELEAVVPTSRGQRLQLGRATVGVFTVNGRAAGCYSRFGGKIITSRAKWLATLRDHDEMQEGPPR